MMSQIFDFNISYSEKQNLSMKEQRSCVRYCNQGIDPLEKGILKRSKCHGHDGFQVECLENHPFYSTFKVYFYPPE